MKYKKFAILYLLVTGFLLILASCLSSVPATATTTSSCGCLDGTLPPEMATAVYGTVFTEIARISSQPGVATDTPVAIATKTPHPTETVWRTEPVSTVASATYTFFDIYGLENLPLPIVQPFDLSEADKKVLSEKIDRYFKENHIQNFLAGESIFIDEIVLVDVDGDGKKESVASYIFTDNLFSTAVGIAIIKDQTVIASTPPEGKGQFPQTRLLPVQLSQNQVGLLYHVVTTTGGSGIYPYIYRKMFTFQNKTLQTVWEWDYPAGARVGGAFRQFANEKVELKYITGQAHADIFLNRQVEGWDFPEPFFGRNPANYANYNLQLPGGLVFSFDGKTYRLSHYYDGQTLVPIHPVDFFIHAPRITQSTQPGDDLSSIFRQKEYMNALDGYGQGLFGRSIDVGDVSVTWDERHLYIRVVARPWRIEKRPSTIWIGLDADLQGDFNDHLLNEDDYLFRIEIPDPEECSDNLLVQMTYPQLAQVPFKNQLLDHSCIVDLGIPLDLIHLNMPLLKTPGKVLTYGSSISSLPLHQYWPQPQAIIGFAVFSKDSQQTKTQVEKVSSGWYHPLPFNVQDPTTWGTLIFMADQ